MSTPLPEFLVARDSGALGDVDQLVRRHSGEFFDLPEGPANFDIRRGRRPQSEVQPAVVNREVRRLAQYFLRLYRIAVPQCNPRPDGAAVRLHPLQLHLEPVMAARHIVAQQRGRLILIHDEDVHVAVVIEVAERATAAGVRRLDPRPGLADQLFEPAFPEVSEDHPRRFVWHIGELLLDFGVDVAGGPEYIRMAAVVQIGQAYAPAHKTGLDAQAGPQRQIAEIPFA